VNRSVAWSSSAASALASSIRSSAFTSMPSGNDEVEVIVLSDHEWCLAREKLPGWQNLEDCLYQRIKWIVMSKWSLLMLLNTVRIWTLLWYYNG
jgi:hypothetical protein